MTRDELAALRDALEAVLTWPDGVREQIARWLRSEAAKPGNGLDAHPPPSAPSPRRVSSGLPLARRPGRWRSGAKLRDGKHRTHNAMVG